MKAKVFNKTTVIVILSIACAVLAWLNWSGPTVVVNPADAVIQKRLEQITAENAELARGIHQRDSVNTILSHQNDSMVILEGQIKIDYQFKYEKNNKLGANALAAEFERVFAEYNIK